MLDLATTVLECVGLALLVAGAGVVVAVLVGGQLGAGAGLAAAGATALALSALVQAVERRGAP